MNTGLHTVADALCRLIHTFGGMIPLISALSLKPFTSDSGGDYKRAATLWRSLPGC